MDGCDGNRFTLGWIKREYSRDSRDSRDEFEDSSRDGFGLGLDLDRWDICICICICMYTVYCTAVLYYYCNYCKKRSYCYDFLSLISSLPLSLSSLSKISSSAAARLLQKEIYYLLEMESSDFLYPIHNLSPRYFLLKKKRMKRKDRLCNNFFLDFFFFFAPFLSFFLSFCLEKKIDGWIEVFLFLLFFV